MKPASLLFALIAVEGKPRKYLFVYTRVLFPHVDLLFFLYPSVALAQSNCMKSSYKLVREKTCFVAEMVTFYFDVRVC